MHRKRKKKIRKGHGSCCSRFEMQQQCPRAGELRAAAAAPHFSNPLKTDRSNTKPQGHRSVLKPTPQLKQCFLKNIKFHYLNELFRNALSFVRQLHCNFNSQALSETGKAQLRDTATSGFCGWLVLMWKVRIATNWLFLSSLNDEHPPSL